METAGEDDGTERSMAELPEDLEERLLACLRARDCDGVLDALARLILAERLQVGEEALNRLMGAAGLARGGMRESPGPGYKPH